MSEPEPIVETETEADVILAHLVAERTGPQQPKLAVHQLALLRKAALLMASDSASDARDLVALLEHAPSVVSPGRKPEPTLAQITTPEAPWDLERLSNEQVFALEDIAAVAQGRSCAIERPRLEAALALVAHLDGERPEVARARELVADVLAPAFTLDDVHPSHAAALNEERARRAALEEEVKRLQRALERAAQPLPANVASLAAARAEREAPIMHCGTGVERLAEMSGAVRPGSVGDISFELVRCETMPAPARSTIEGVRPVAEAPDRAPEMRGFSDEQWDPNDDDDEAEEASTRKGMTT